MHKITDKSRQTRARPLRVGLTMTPRRWRVGAPELRPARSSDNGAGSASPPARFDAANHDDRGREGADDRDHEPRAAGCLVLLVEDDEDIRTIVATVLLDEGYDVHEVESGDRALAWLRHARRVPCVVLTDLMMPGLSGWSLIESLRTEARFVALPVLVISNLERCRAPAGIDGFMRKPIDIDLMLSLLKRRCHHGR